MQNCYLCHRPIVRDLDVNVEISWTERGINGDDPGTIREFIHWECLDRAERSLQTGLEARHA